MTTEQLDADRPPLLVLGPLLRHVGETTASVWVETGRPARVHVRTATCSGEAGTFNAHGHHYAIVDVTGLEPGSAEPYEVWIDDGDGEHQAWPPPGSGFPPSALRTLDLSRPLRVVFGTCRESLPHDPSTNRRYGIDLLRALALRLAHGKPPERSGAAGEAWPAMLLFLGDQVYADETSDAMRDFIASRRDIDAEPGEELADFEEYAYLYRLAWTEPATRWVLSTCSSSMVFDDHDVRDDWNTSQAWRDEMNGIGWWHRRIVGGLASYWIYQHLGNLGPDERADDEVWQRVQQACSEGPPGTDVGPLLDEFAERADRDPAGYRWSWTRRLGDSRLLVLDSRAGRMLEPGERSMLDPDEMQWAEDLMVGDHDHVIVGTSLPFLLPMGLHHLEAWNEAVTDGAWGDRHKSWGERLRQDFDLEHWGAFQESFQRLARRSAEVAQGAHGDAPATVLWLAGDVHHSYLAEAELPRGTPGRVLQAVCSPIRNPLPRSMRFVLAGLAYGVANAVGAAVARSAKVPDPPWRWSIRNGPWFDNMLATLDLDGRHATLAWETATVGPTADTLRWRTVFRTRLS